MSFFIKAFFWAESSKSHRFDFSGRDEDCVDTEVGFLAQISGNVAVRLGMDAGSLDEQAAVLVHLAEKAPLAMAVHSGRRSVHGWFYSVGQPEESLRAFMDYAVRLGADRSTWTRSQFVRMPDGTRDCGAWQAVYFLNPEVVK